MKMLVPLDHSTARRTLLRVCALSAIATVTGFASRAAHALSWGDITNQDAVAGLKSALNSSTVKAVEKLAIEGGFWNNAKVKIPLPGYLEDARSVMNAIGMRKQAEELQMAMNRAAENAVGEAKPIFGNAIKSMSVQDAMASSPAGKTRARSISRARLPMCCAPSFCQW